LAAIIFEYDLYRKEGTMKHNKLLVILIFLFFFSPQTGYSADIFTPLVNVFNGVLEAFARTSTSNLSLFSKDILEQGVSTDIKLVIGNSAGRPMLDWSGYWEESGSTLNEYSIYRSTNQKDWELVGKTKLPTYIDTAISFYTNYYKVIANYSDHKVASNVAPFNPMQSISFNSVPAAKQQSYDKMIEVTYTFADPTFEITSDGFQVMSVNGLYNEGTVGTPMLPYRAGHLLIPDGYKVASIEYDNLDTIIYKDKVLAPQQPAIPISSTEDQKTITVNESVYKSNTPNVSLSSQSPQLLSGYEILPLLITPVTYYAKDKKVIFARKLKVTVNLVADRSIGMKNVLRPSSIKQINNAKKIVQALIDNRDALENDTQLKINSVQKRAVSNTYDLIIIAPQGFSSAYAPLITYKQSLGMKVLFVSTEQIFSNQAGVDNAQKIKNYIKYAYTSYGIQYVVLGADSEYVPTRKVPSYIGDYGGPDDQNINTDIYYACLDDGWDPNGNRIYAERGENYDRYSEVYVGRFPASSATEVTNMVNKTIQLSSMDPQTPYMKKTVVLGENLDSYTSGSSFTTYLSTALAAKFSVTKYADDVKYWGGSDLVSLINSNSAQFYSHMGHSNHVYNAKLNNSSVQSLNNSLPFIYYTDGCFPNYFVYSDSISEAYLTGAKGAAAFIGNTHYGWYYRGAGDGPSARYHNEFNKAVVQKDIKQISRAAVASREVMFPYWSVNDGSNCYRLLYFAINVLGDPSLEIVTDFTARKGVSIVSGFDQWERGTISVQTSAIGDKLIAQSLYYRIGDNDSWKQLTTVSSLTLAYELDTTAYGDIQSFQLKAVAQYPDGNSDSQIASFGIDNTPPVTSTTVQNKTYNTEVSINIVSFDAMSGVDKIFFSIGDIAQQEYTDSLIISQGGNYNLSFYSLDKAGNKQNTVTVSFTIDKEARQGFPIQLTGAIYGVPTYKDIDEDGNVEIVVQSNDGKVYIFNHDGTPFTGWENGKEIGVKGAGSPAIADVDNDGRDEIIVFGSFVGISVYEIDVSLKWKNLVSGLSNNSSPVIADINNDGIKDILIATDGKLYALEGMNGTVMAGFPVNLSGGASFDIFGTPAVGDIDGDGDLEIALAFSTADVNPVTHFQLYHHNGVLIWDKTTPSVWMTASPVMGDINNDGKVEIIFAGGQEPAIYVFNSLGNPISGYPFRLASGHFALSPVLSDIDSDGYLDIIIPHLDPSDNKLFAVNYRGQIVPNFPVQVKAELSSSAVIGDLDGDGKPDILVGGNRNQLYAYTQQGALVSGFPKQLGSTMGLSPVLVDLENDGKTDILSGDWSGKISAWSTNGVYDSDNTQWSTFQHDPYHTGFYPTVFLESPATYYRTNGQVLLKVKTFSNYSWVKKIDFEYSFNSTNGINGTWQQADGIYNSPVEMLWDSQPKGNESDVYVRARSMTMDNAYSSYVFRKIYIDNKPAANVTNLKVTDPSDNGEKLLLSWTKSADDGAGRNDLVNYYLVVNDGEQSVTLGRGVTSYTLATDKMRTYTFFVKTFDGLNYNQCEKTGPVTPKDENPPYKVGNVVVTDNIKDNGGVLGISWNHSLSFNWTDLTISYKLYRSEHGLENWSMISSWLRDNKYTDYSATVNQVFDYKVIVTDKTYDIASDVATGSSKDDLAPALPVNFGVYDVAKDNGEAVIAAWTKSADDGAGSNDLSKYIVYIGSTVVELPPGSTTYTLTGTQKNKPYTFSLKTVDYNGNQAQTIQTSCYARDNRPPQVPTITVADVLNDAGGQVQISYPRSADDGGGSNDLVKYVLYRKFLNDLDGVSVSEQVADGHESYAVKVNTVDTVVYQFRLAVTDGENWSYGSWVDGSSIDNIPPKGISNFKGEDNPSDNGYQIKLTWTKSEDDGAGAKDVTGYTVYRKDAGEWIVVATLLKGVTSYIDSGVSNNAVYRYKIETRDKSCVTTTELPYGVIPIDNLPPDEVKDLTVQDNPNDNGGKTAVTWTKNTDDTISYVIYRNDEIIGTLNAVSINYFDNVPFDNVSYSYYILAYDGVNYSKGKPVIGFAKDNLVVPPTLLKAEDVAQDNGGMLKVTWIAPVSEPNLSKYFLYRNNLKLTILDADVTSYIDTAATKNIIFSYCLKSVDRFGNEASSNVLPGLSLDNINPYPIELYAQDRADDNGENIELSWKFDNFESDVVYTILRNGAVISSFNTYMTTYTDNSVAPNILNSYLIKADDGKNVITSNVVHISSIDNIVPDFNKLIKVEDNFGDNGKMLVISWDRSKALDVKGYKLYRSLDGSTFDIRVTLNGATANTVTYTDNVENNHLYYYKVVVSDGTNEVASNIASGKAIDNIAPEKVKNLTIINIQEESQVRKLFLAWQGPAEAGLSYSLYKNGQLLADNLLGTTYTDMNITKGIVCNYYILSDDGTYRTKSDTVSGVLVDLTGKDKENDNGNSIQLSWSCEKSAEYSTYNVRREGALIKTYRSNSMSYIDDTVDPNNEYVYEITADDGILKIFSTAVKVKAIDNLPPDVKPLAVADNLNDNGGVLNVTWSKSSAPDIKGYKVYGSSDGISFAMVASFNAVTFNLISYTDNVTNNKKYYYKILVFDGTYDVESNVAYAMAVDNVAPETVKDFVVIDTRNDNGTSLSLSWENPPETGLKYQLYRNGQLLKDDDLRDTVYIDNGLVKGKSYSYCIVADDCTYRTTSNTITATPLDDYINPVKDVSVSDVPDDEGYALRLSWTNPADTDLKSIVICRNGQIITQLEKTAISYIDAGVLPSVNYLYTIEVSDMDNNRSLVSVNGIAIDNTGPEPVTKIDVTDPYDNGGILQMSWIKSDSKDVIGYEIYRMEKNPEDKYGPWKKISTIMDRNIECFEDKGLDLLTIYIYKVRVFDSRNQADSKQSEPTLPKDEIVPQQVVLNAVDNPNDEGGVIYLYWTASDPDVVIYRVIRNGHEIGSTTNLKYYDLAVEGKYEVIAEDRAGNQSKSNPTNRVCAYRNIPVVTVEDVAPDNGSQLKLFWACEDPAFSAVTIMRKTSYDDSSKIIKYLSNTDHQYIDNKVNRDTTYIYELTYTNSSGPHTIQLPPVTPKDEITPDQINDLRAEYVLGTGGKTIKLTWSKVVDTKISSLGVYRSSGSINQWQRIAVCSSALVEYLDAASQPSVTYNYKIESFSNLASTASNIVSVKSYDDTPPPAPEVIDVPNDRGTQLKVIWPVLGVDKINKTSGLMNEWIKVSSVSTAAIVSNLNSDTDYRFSYTVNLDGHEIESVFSGVVRPKIDIYISAPVTNFLVTDVSPDNGDNAILTWVKSADDGNGFNDISFYIVYRNNERIATLNKGDTTYIANKLTPGWVNTAGYRFKVAALNSSGREAFSPERSIIPQDEKPPKTPVNFHFATTTVKNELWLQWDKNLDDTKGYYVYKNGEKYRVLTSGDSLSIDTGLSYNVTYSYQVSAFDNAGNESFKTNVISKMFFHTAMLSPGINLISVPYIVTELSMSDCIRDPQLIVYNWNGKKYSIGNEPFTPANSCFVKVQNAVEVKLNNPKKLTQDYTLKIAKGWNLISDPFFIALPCSAIKIKDSTVVYSWADAVKARIIASKLFGLNEAHDDYKEITVLNPFEGAWIKAFKDIELIFPYSTEWTSLSTLANQGYSTSKTNGWVVTIKVQGKSFELGQSDDAVDGYDYHDSLIPPQIAGFNKEALSFYEEQSSWGEYSGYYKADIKKKDSTWKMIVENAGVPVIPVMIEGLNSLPKSKTLIVTDRNGNIVPLNGNSFSLAGEGGFTVFTIQVLDSSDFFEISGLVNYPNPCNINKTDVKVKFNSNKTGAGDIKIYSVTGKEIYKNDFNFVVGDNIIRWDGSTHSRERVASGVYFYLIDARSVDGSSFKKKEKIAIWNN